MPRYIDADALLERMKRTPRYFDVKHDIEAMPTADVVPREEVEKLRKENIELELKNQLLYDEGKNWYDEYQKIKEELKQEKKYKRASEKLADKYFVELQTAKQEVAREIFEEIEKQMVVFDTSLTTCFRGIGWQVFAELKKKYVEGTDGKQA